MFSRGQAPLIRCPSTRSWSDWFDLIDQPQRWVRWLTKAGLCAADAPDHHSPDDGCEATLEKLKPTGTACGRHCGWGTWSICTLQCIALLSREGVKLHSLHDHLEHAPRWGRSHVHSRNQSLFCSLHMLLGAYTGKVAFKPRSLHTHPKNVQAANRLWFPLKWLVKPLSRWSSLGLCMV